MAMAAHVYGSSLFNCSIRGVTGVLSLVSMITVYRFVSTQFGGIPVGECEPAHTTLEDRRWNRFKRKNHTRCLFHMHA